MITVPSEAEDGLESSSTGTTEEYTATVICIVTDFDDTKSSSIIKKNNTIIEAPLIYNIQCASINNGTQFTCTVNITKITIQNKEYTVNNATGVSNKRCTNSY